MLGELRTWTVEHQTALLFMVLFGALLLVTAVTFMVSLRQRDEGGRGRMDRFVRDLRAVWLGSTIFWLAWVSGPVGATLLAGVLSFLALREFITLTHTTHGDHRTLILAFFVALPLQYVLVANRRFDLFSVLIPVYVFFAIPVASALGGDPKRFLERTAKIQWGVTVCVYGLSHAPALLLLQFPHVPDPGAFLLFFLVVVVGVAQIAQEAMTRWLRMRPVARQISRTFSWRAWFTGAAAGALAGGLLYWTLPFKPGQALAMGLIAAGSGTLGEFVMGAVKRDAGVRYWGNRSSITGAVGLLDRVSALCFAAPVFFHSVRWYFQANA